MLDHLWLDALILALAAFVRFFVAAPVRVKGRSMLPAFRDGSVVLMLHARRFRRGDVVICHYPNRYRGKRIRLRQNFIKRVVGLPGEVIEIVEGEVRVGGHALHEPYLDEAHTRFRRSMPPRQLGADEYFVLGDNRDASNDSRRVGPLPRKLLVGRVAATLWRGRGSRK